MSKSKQKIINNKQLDTMKRFVDNYPKVCGIEGILKSMNKQQNK